MYLHICDFLKNRLKEDPIFRTGVNVIIRVYRKTCYLIEYILLCYKINESSMTNSLLKTGEKKLCVTEDLSESNETPT
jgi:hypothetical protein